jgi:hypothetical protein
MAKIILIALVVYLFIRIIKNYQRNLQQDTKNPAAEQDANEDIVQCKTCGLYLPKKESLAWQQQYYCCQTHLPDNTPRTK